jgi:hypothetical protein
LVKIRWEKEKVRLAVIPPVAYLEDFSTNYHLVLAHLYATNETYRDFYNSRVEKGDWVILDNGCAELGEAIPGKELFRLAADLNPNVLVCPDVLRDGLKTRELTEEFIKTWRGKLKDGGIALMAVPQGKTREEWLDCFETFNEMKEVEWLGISKYCPGERVELLEQIKLSVKKKCHLLGMAETEGVNSILKEKAFSFAYSTDTAIPVKLGLQGLSLEQYLTRGHMKDDDYFNFEKLNWTNYKVGWARRNIDEYLKRCE